MRRLLIAILALVVVGLVAFAALAWYPAIAEVEPAARTTFDAARVAKGAELARIGNCNDCHQQPKGAPYAGGQALPTPFGTIYVTNITPDPETGIGRWSEAAFLRAIREGVDRAGRHLYPAFPYDHFTKLTNEDIGALYAFLMTRRAVRAPAQANRLSFPLNWRPLLAGWKLLYLKRGPAQGNEASDRGAYLVEALAHCGSCHSPRNRFGAEERNRAFGGGEAEDWHAPALNADSPAPHPWTRDQLFTYLRHGFVEPHGVAAGPMQSVTNNLGSVREEDVQAIAAYVARTLEPATAGRESKAQQAQAKADRAGGAFWRPASTTGSGSADPASGAVIYAGACAMCHNASGLRFSAQGIPLASSKVVAMPDPRNLIHVIMEGITQPHGAAAALMPGFATALTDPQVTALVAFVRTTFSDQPAWGDVENQVKKIRRQSGG